VRKHDFQELKVVLQSFNVQILLIDLISSLNLEVWLKVKFSASIGLNYALQKLNMAQAVRKHDFQEL